MPVFTYRGVNRTGATVTGERTAASKAEFAAALRREQINVSKLSEKGKEFNIPTFGTGVDDKELAVFTRQFSVMIDAGLPLVQCLEILAGQQENKIFQKILTGVRASVEGGATLSHAMKQYEKVFDPLYSNMVEAGETGGILDTILQRLATYIEKNVKLKRAVKSAMIYPVSVIAHCRRRDHPSLVESGSDFRDSVQWSRCRFAAPHPHRHRPEQLRRQRLRFADLLLLRRQCHRRKVLVRHAARPLRRLTGCCSSFRSWDPVLRKIAVARFTRTLGTLISSGVPILEGLDITARTSGNAVVEKAIMQTRKAVEAGRSLVDPLKETDVFPGMVTQMIGVGEQTGAMDAMLQKIADFYEDEVDAAVKDLLTAIEPIMIVFLGVVVGGVVISMYLPLFSLIGKLSGH